MKRKVFIIWSQSLFHDTVSLLLDDPLVTVVGRCLDADIANSQLHELQPDTIIVEDVAIDGECEPDIMQLLQDFAWNPRIVRLSLYDNKLCIYKREAEDHQLKG